MHLRQKIRSGPFLKKFLKWALICLAAYTVTGFFIAPSIVKAVLAKKLSERLDRDVVIKKVGINPFSLSTNVNGLIIREHDGRGTMLSFDELYLNIQAVSIFKKGLTLREIRIDRPYMNIIRNEDASYNFSDLLEQKGNETGPDSDRSGPELNAGLVRITGGNIRFSDLSTKEPVRADIRGLDITAENISTARAGRGTFSISCGLNNKGSMTAEGSLAIETLSADMSLNMRDIDIIPFQPYFTEKVKIMVTGGGIMVDGGLSIRYLEDSGFNALFKGDASLSEFSSVDKAGPNDFLGIGSLYLNGIEAGYGPLKVHIAKASLSDFNSRLILTPDGSLNVQGILNKDGEEPEAGAEHDREDEQGGPEETIIIDAITLQAGTISFSDRYISPGYSAELLEIGGRVSGLSSETDTAADVDLRGKLENQAPLEITGKIDPLRDDLFVDLEIDFRDMDLSPLSPYTGKYAGYKIEKGRLSLDLKYFIERKKLDSQNKVFLDQFTFGEKVDSPDATKLPVKLAVALLKNPRGEITLDLPVTGNIDDPEFHPGSVISKLIVNLLVKAATSPFALLGALVGGGGEELSYVDFDYGSANLDKQSGEKLDTLIKALLDRPFLQLEVTGHADTEKDSKALRQYLFDRKIKAQKLKDIVSGLETAVTVDEIRVGPEEYEKYLWKAYKAETFPRPRNVLGVEKKLPVTEMEKLMITHIEINDNDLRTLASRRALNVKDYILRSGRMDEKRVLLTEPVSIQPDEDERSRNSCVRFHLRQLNGPPRKKP